MSGRPENKIGSVHARDETTGPDDAVFGFGCFRRLASLRAASSARTTRTWRRRAGRAAGRRHQRSDYQRSIQISELCCPSCLHTSWFARPPSGGLEAATDYKQVLACVRAWPYGVDKCNKKMQVVLQSHQHFRPRVAV